MMKELKNNIKNIFLEKIRQENLDENLSHSSAREFSNSLIVEQGEKLSIAGFPSVSFSDKIGTHPDFLNDIELPKKQYVCSIFLDIKGSTKLALKYDLELVQKIKNAVISTGIEIIRYFGGHVHRLQGDAIFAFTGHKKLLKSDAMIQAINAASVIQYMNKTILNDYFENVWKVPALKIRIGIDFGDDKEVLWSKYGVDGINEVTVTSLHADLASKLQSKSAANSIMLGENVFSYLQLPDDLTDYKKKGGASEETDYYILRYKSFNYKMKEFNWSKYLDRISHFDSLDGMELKCYYKENHIDKPYYSDRALGKELELIYQIEMSPLLKENITNIEWRIINFGVEATEKDELDFIVPDENFGEVYLDKLRYTTKTMYNGLHYVVCKVKTKSISLDKTLYFSLYVNDNALSLDYLKKIVLEE